MESEMITVIIQGGIGVNPSHIIHGHRFRLGNTLGTKNLPHEPLCQPFMVPKP